MNAPVEYEIKKVSDFLKVPADRRRICMAEFIRYLDHMAPYQELIETGSLDAVFIWCDDWLKTTDQEAHAMCIRELSKTLEEMKKILEKKR